MPDVQGALVAPWGAGQHVAGGTLAPWGRAGRVQAFGTAYTPPAPPPGSDTFTPNDLTAPLALGPASSYHQAHTLAVTDLRTSTALRVDRLSLSLDDGAAFWTLAAEGPLELFDVLTGGEQPALVQVQVDGHTWAFVVETVARPRSSRPTRVTFGGRSVAAVADAPYQFALTYSAEAPTTAAQLCAGALLAAGVALDWKLADWPIPAGAVSIQGTPMDVVRAVAGAVGAVVTAHPSDYRITVQSRYDLLPNEWAYAPPDVQLHSSAVESETFDRADKPAYTGVFVAGQQGGALGYVRLEGTSGGDQAPMVTDALLTDVEALRERARAVLGAGGKQARVTRVLPVCTGVGQPGVLERGALVRCIDAAANGAAGQSIWPGVVRSVGLAVQPPVVQQTLGFERHTEHVVDPQVVEPLVFEGAIPDQTGEVEAAFSLDLTPYRSGGLPPYQWSLRSGSLPAGLFISGESIVGTPLAVQEATPLRLRVTDAVAQMQDSAEFDFTILTSSRLLTLTFEDTYQCAATGITFAPTGSVSFDPVGAFGKGVKINGAVSSASRLNSGAASELWDLMGTSDDWCICGWFRADELLLSQEKRVLQVWASGLNSNQNVTVTVFSVTSNTQLRVRIYHPFAELFLTNAQVLIPYDNEPHFVAAGRVGNTLYCSVDGSARTGLDGGTTGGTSWTTSASFRSTPGPRNIVVGNNTVNTGAFRGMLDSLQIIRGYPFDVVNGFTVPAVPVV